MKALCLFLSLFLSVSVFGGEYKEISHKECKTKIGFRMFYKSQLVKTYLKMRTMWLYGHRDCDESLDRLHAYYEARFGSLDPSKKDLERRDQCRIYGKIDGGAAFIRRIESYCASGVVIDEFPSSNSRGHQGRVQQGKIMDGQTRQANQARQTRQASTAQQTVQN